MLKLLATILCLAKALPELVVRKDITQQIYSVNVEAQEAFFGDN
jgi:hypothetical protein